MHSRLLVLSQTTFLSLLLKALGPACERDRMLVTESFSDARVLPPLKFSLAASPSCLFDTASGTWWSNPTLSCLRYKFSVVVNRVKKIKEVSVGLSCKCMKRLLFALPPFVSVLARCVEVGMRSWWRNGQCDDRCC